MRRASWRAGLCDSTATARLACGSGYPEVCRQTWSRSRATSKTRAGTVVCLYRTYPKLLCPRRACPARPPPTARHLTCSSVTACFPSPAGKGSQASRLHEVSGEGLRPHWAPAQSPGEGEGKDEGKRRHRMGVFRGTLKLSQVVSIFLPFEAYPQVHVSCGGLSSSGATYHISNTPMYAYRHGGRDGSRLDERGTKGQKRQRARGLAFWWNMNLSSSFAQRRVDRTRRRAAGPDSFPSFPFFLPLERCAWRCPSS